MRRPSTREIEDAQGDAHVYVVTEFGADEGFDLAMDLVSIVGDAISSVASALVLDQGAALGMAAMRIAAKVQEKGGSALAKRILRDTTRDGKKLAPNVKGEGDEKVWTFNAAYRANYGELLRALAFALEVNFKSFFAGSTADLKNLMREMAVGPPPEN